MRRLKCSLAGNISRTILATQPGTCVPYFGNHAQAISSKHMLSASSRQIDDILKLSPFLQPSRSNWNSGAVIFRPYQQYAFHTSARREQQVQKEKVAPGTPTVPTLDEALEDKAFSLSERAQVHT